MKNYLLDFTGSSNIKKTIDLLNAKNGGAQVSLEDIRMRQDPKLCDEIFSEAVTRLSSLKTSKAPGRLFFAGSVDFMVNRERGKSKFYILETNGGSSRGFSVMTPNAWLRACLGYYEAVKHIKSKKPVILIGCPSKDLLLYEKMILAQVFSEKIRSDFGKNPKQLDAKLDGFDKNHPAIIVAPYHDIIPYLDISDSKIAYKGLPVDILIGDGIARRNKKVCKNMLRDKLDSIVVNEIFHITDDKSLTYSAVSQAAKLLSRFNVKPFFFWRSWSKKTTIQAVTEGLRHVSEILIKPHGGSGGSGIDVITKKDNIEKKINESMEHYYEKFGKDRNPFPYTICECVKATPAKWRNSMHQFDIRIYVAREKDEIIPVGALCRIAKDPFLGKFTKKTFVVNLSGYGGVDTSRGLGISPETLEILNLTKKDFVDMFCSAATLTAFICSEYKLLKTVIETDLQIESRKIQA